MNIKNSLKTLKIVLPISVEKYSHFWCHKRQIYIVNNSETKLSIYYKVLLKQQKSFKITLDNILH